MQNQQPHNSLTLQLKRPLADNGSRKRPPVFSESRKRLHVANESKKRLQDANRKRPLVFSVNRKRLLPASVLMSNSRLISNSNNPTTSSRAIISSRLISSRLTKPYDQAGPQGPGVPPVPPFPPTTGGSSDFSVMSILTEGIPLGIANFVTIFGATILWLLTFWIPYLNVGTTIALNTMPIALADNEAPEGPTYIFKDKYRKYMGEYFVLMGLMYMAIWMASIFLIIPGIVISLAWSQALYLLFDKHLTPMDAMKESNEKTYGHKWTIFLTGLVFAIAFGIFAMIVLWLFITIDVMFLTVIAVLLLIALAMVGSVGINAVIYRKLCK